MYDSFAGLLQITQSVALAAEAGEYDQVTSDIVVEREADNEQRHISNGAQDDDAVAQELVRSEKLVDREKDDERSISSAQTRPPSDSSSARIDDGDSDHDSEQDRRTEEDPRGAEADRERSGLTEQDTQGGDQLRLVSHDDEKISANVEHKVDGTAATVPEARNNQHTRCEEKDTEAARIEVLKGMLEKLDCGHWSGAVDVVLEKIEELSQWIPEPVMDPLANAEPAIVRETTTGTGRAELDEHESGGVGKDVRRATDGDSQGGATDDGTRSGGDSDEGAQENEEDEDEDEDEEQEDDDEDGEDEGGDRETDADGEFIVDDEEVRGQHPLLREQRLLRAQWRRLLLDAELEPETSIRELMRGEVVAMVEAIPGAVEEARREAGGLPGGAPVTPRGRSVLGYDEVRYPRLALGGMSECELN